MRVLLVGGGRPGLALTRALTADGHAVRFVTRTEDRRADIEAAGGECWIGTPDRIGSLRLGLDNVTVLLWLLGPVPDGDLHGSRLTMMLERTIDTTVRAVIYEGAGSLSPEHFASGRAVVQRLCTKNEIPFVVLEADSADPEVWASAADDALAALLARDRG